MVENCRISAVRPLVRYVDEERAVIDARFSTGWAWSETGHTDTPKPVRVLIEINGSDGFHDEDAATLRMTRGEGSVRFDLVQPQRWWPAGMGDQALYELSVSLAVGDRVIDHHSISLGLASIREDAPDELEPWPRLLVNGQVCVFQDVITVDRVDESQLLPATGDSILLVRDHYGPDVLYEAADRAGILLIQCIPLHPDGTPEVDVAAQVNRLATHPSLAGWFVGHLGRLADDVADHLRGLDPSRTVFRDFPTRYLDPAA